MKNREMVMNISLVCGACMAWMLVFLLFRWYVAALVAFAVALGVAITYVCRVIQENRRQRRELEQLYAEVMARAMRHAVVK